MINPTVLYNSFSAAFITQYQTAFTELVRLGQVASEKAIEGRESKLEDQRAKEILLVLEALDNPELEDNEIESLEYCLRVLNDSLVVPTVASIVAVSPRAHVPVAFDLHTYWPGFFTMSGQSNSMRHIIPFIMPAEKGAFTLVGVGAGLVYHKSALSMTAGNGSFALTGQVIDLDLVHNNQYPIEMTLNEAIPGVQQWNANFDWGSGSTNLVASGPVGSDAGNIMAEETSVTVTVTKLTNGGYTQDAWQIVFTLNGLMVDVARVGGAGELVNESYVFTGLSHLDQLGVDVIEG